MRRPILLASLVLAFSACGQVSITTGSYVQDFGTTDVTSWTNNVTYPGWYRSSGTFAGHQNITAAAPSNTGGFYTYECAGNNDQKIGSRASGSASLIRYGVVFRNQTGFPIYSMRVSYRGYQLSLAENGSTVNTITVDYVVSAALPAITAGATASVPALNFVQIMNSTTAGSNQITGYPCNQYRDISSCVAFATAVPNNYYILLRWTDIDDSWNDHHMAIDDLQVDFDPTGTACSTLLPIELLSFTATPEGDGVRLEWSTVSERDNAAFVIHRGRDPQDLHPILGQAGAGTHLGLLQYTDFDDAPLAGISYYMLQQIDVDGSTSLSDLVAVDRGARRSSLLITPLSMGPDRFLLNTGWDGPFHTEVYDQVGRKVHGTLTSGPGRELDLSSAPSGVYLVVVRDGDRMLSGRVLVGH
ncbi:MAG TPA: T9SS type A sorting domain-containing protein [Flavobacteriales bacterium]|mgnify:CR=1 FL=1|nr:T9SS type A sorting domain-containing protein [Flavobacteriales bacterium]HNU55263.1 T9SS type A sorting domain-containing protein [Flavobacteriales bacterium]